MTTPLEEKLRDKEIKELLSISRAGISTVVVVLRDDVVEVETVWSRIRDSLSDAETNLPEAALAPEFRTLKLKANAAILAVVWDAKTAADWAALDRHAEDLRLKLSGIQGTEEVGLFGNPSEQCLVELEGRSHLQHGAVSRSGCTSDPAKQLSPSGGSPTRTRGKSLGAEFRAVRIAGATGADAHSVWGPWRDGQT